MKRSIPLWQMAGFLFTSVLGTLLHFFFDLAGQTVFAALFSAVNESIWEHMKLLFYPMFLFALVEHRVWGQNCPCFWERKLLGILVGLALIPVLYYTYTGILGTSADWFNIAIFFLSAGVVYRLETGLLERKSPCRLPRWLPSMLLILLMLLFTVLTFLPPRIPFFEDPVTGTYGFQGSR